jgi:hypothetical protein
LAVPNRADALARAYSATRDRNKKNRRGQSSCFFVIKQRAGARIPFLFSKRASQRKPR